MKIARNKQKSEQALEDAKMAARLAAGQRISTRPSASNKNGTKKSAAEQALLHYKGPTTKEEVEEQIALKREKVLLSKNSDRYVFRDKGDDFFVDLGFCFFSLNTHHACTVTTTTTTTALLQQSRERVAPMGMDRYGNKYWSSPSIHIDDEDTPVLLLVEHCITGRFHSYMEEKDIQQLMTSLLTQVRVPYTPCR